MSAPRGTIHTEAQADTDRRVVAVVCHAPSVAAALVGAVGLIVLVVGWGLRVDAVTRVLPGFETMKANTALGFVLAAASLWMANRPERGVRFAGRLVALFVLALGGLSLAEHVLGIDLAIDRFVAYDPNGGAPYPGRPSPATSFGFVLAGLFLLRLGRRAGPALLFREALAYGLAALAYLALAGYILGPSSLYAVRLFRTMAVHTALLFFVLAVGMSLLDRRSWLVRTAVRRSAEGQVLRRLLPAVVAVPLGLAWLALEGMRADLFEPPFALSLFVLGSSLVLAVLLFRTVNAVALAERRREELVAALRRDDEQKDQFLAMLGHELRNPLAAIRMATELLSHQVGEGPSARAVATLSRQTGHMGRILDDLLDVSRIVRGKLTLQPERLDLRKVLVEACADYDGPAKERGLRLRLRGGKGEPLWVDGDPARLYQILDNLLSNALRFTPPPGEVVFEARRRDGQVEISVQDTGVGLSPEELGPIFEVFQQREQGLARAAGGLGLGLPLVKGLAELHGGTVEATSEGPGRGARFTVRLPAAPPPEATEEAAAAQAPPRPQRVLVIEDNRDIAESLAQLLREEGHEVEVAYDGAGGLARVGTFRPDVVLSDLGLPGDVDGFEVARHLAAEARRARLVAVTGYGQREDERRARAAGFDDFLVKPVDLARLRGVLCPRDLR